MKIFLWLILCLICFTPLAADLRTEKLVLPLEIDESGQIITQATIFDQKGNAKKLRLLLDTGSSITILNSDLAPNFFFEEPKTSDAKMVDSTNTAISFTPTILKRFEWGNVRKDNFAISFFDLKNSIFGRVQDQPCDGILGMDVLRGTRFVLNVSKKTLSLWQSLEGTRLALGYNQMQLPTLTMFLAQESYQMILDTGSSAAFSFTPSNFDDFQGSEFSFGGLGNTVFKGKKVYIEELSFPDASFTKFDLEITRKEESIPQIGRSVFSAMPVEFDFVHNNLVFQKPVGSAYPLLNLPQLPVFSWDRSDKLPKLFVERITEDSLEWNLGFRTGDKIISVNGNEKINIALLRSICQANKVGIWKVERAGKIMEISHQGRM